MNLKIQKKKGKNTIGHNRHQGENHSKNNPHPMLVAKDIALFYVHVAHNQCNMRQFMSHVLNAKIGIIFESNKHFSKILYQDLLPDHSINIYVKKSKPKQDTNLIQIKPNPDPNKINPQNLKFIQILTQIVNTE